jgi:hypothetical protein
VISLPWYLLAVGIGLILLGFVLAGLPSDRGGRPIHAKMRDKDIIRELDRAGRTPLLPSLIIFAGLGCVLVSIVWRIGRMVL